MGFKTVDIIIPTYKPDKKFDLLILKLLGQSYPIQKIIIIHTRTGSFPWDTVGLSERITVVEIEKDEFDHGGTRRMAAEMSDAELFICMTQDAVPRDDKLVEHLAAAFEDEQVGCAYARQIADANCDVIERYTRQFNYPALSSVKDAASIETLGIKAFFCSNVCAAYRKVYYDEVGGFVKRAIFNEDMIMAGRMLKAGFKCAYTADAEVIHSHNYTGIQQFKRNFDVAVSQQQYQDIFGGIRSEGEGMRLVKQTGKFLIHQKNPWLLVKLFVKSGFKYFGYLAGKNYKRLPLWLVVKCSSNPKYWIYADKFRKI